MITANNNAQTAPQQNPYEMASNLFGSAQDTFNQMGQGAGSLTNINAYINPYYQQVIDKALGRMQTNYQQTLGSIGDSAISAGAFGGDRHGVMEGVAAGEYNRNVGEIAANLGMQSFESAADRAYRDMVTSAQGKQGLGTTMFNVGNTLTDRQMQQGSMQQALLQQILSGGADMFNQQMQNPYQMVDMMRAILSGDPRQQQGSATQTTQPGLFDYLALAMQGFGGS